MHRDIRLMLLAGLTLALSGCFGSGAQPRLECAMTDSSGLEWRARAGDQTEAEASVLYSCESQSKDPASCRNIGCAEILSE